MLCAIKLLVDGARMRYTRINFRKTRSSDKSPRFCQEDVRWDLGMTNHQMTILDWDPDQNMKSITGKILTKKWIEPSIILRDS
jgi:hypothetical protein